MRKTLTLLTTTLALTLGFAAWGPAPAAWADENVSEDAQTPDQDVMGALKADPRYSMFVELLESVGADETLRSTPDITVFAPTNAAIESSDLEILEKVKTNKKRLKKVLLWHAAEGKHLATDLAASPVLQSLSGRKLKIKSRGERVVVGGRRIAESDVMAANGVLHTLESMMLPAPPKKDPVAEEPA